MKTATLFPSATGTWWCKRKSSLCTADKISNPILLFCSSLSFLLWKKRRPQSSSLSWNHHRIVIHHYTAPNYARTMTRKRKRQTLSLQREENKILFSLVPFFWHESRAFFLRDEAIPTTLLLLACATCALWYLESCLFWLFLVVWNIWDESAFITRFKRCIGRRGSLRRCEHRTSSSSRFSRLLVVLCVCSSLRDDLLFASLFFSPFLRSVYWWCN